PRLHKRPTGHGRAPRGARAPPVRRAGAAAVDAPAGATPAADAAGPLAPGMEPPAPVASCPTSPAPIYPPSPYLTTRKRAGAARRPPTSVLLRDDADRTGALQDGVVDLVGAPDALGGAGLLEDLLEVELVPAQPVLQRPAPLDEHHRRRS